MSQAALPLKQRGWGQTMRRDAWWVQPLAVFLGLAAFLVYANFRVFEGAHYYSGHSERNAATNYLTPFYSPLLFDVPGVRPSGHAWWSEKPALLAWLPGWVSPAALILIFPAGFRFTCYYYRGAYYKAFWADPPSCAVGEPRKGYRGENSLPLILQNVHRYFLLFAVLFLFILSYDVWHALWFKDGAGGYRFGVGLGTLILATNVVLLTGYTFGCHSMRHLMGGGRDCVTKAPLGHGFYECVSCLNRRHMLWAWLSLFSVAFSDVYVRMLAAGVWADWRIF
ncbi:MAG: succinate dehydrogenase [Phycisphaerae bacterium]|nr:succinate dehydrogenase [Phycisphaerae bacterium]MCZ2400443.1 succinate dehydrogenase [Phycisphaerae bacterium]NUQ49775.1 succinate dehydrogenase [Phycisphaerae bacterium]